MRRGPARAAAMILAAALATSAAGQPGGFPPTESGAPARGPAQERAIELVRALSADDPTILTDYLKSNTSPAYTKQNPERRLRWARFMMGGKPVIEAFRKATDRSVVAVVRNPVTGRWNSFFVAVEAEAPHRISRASLDPFTAPPTARHSVVPPTEAQRMAHLSAYAAKLAKADRFSGVVVIARGDRVIFEKAYGYADRGFKVPNALDTRFNVASIDKVFTALAVGQLVEQGKLSYEDPLSKFLDYPDRATAETIKLKHLLSHTSGLGDYATGEFDAMRASLGSLDDYMTLLDKLKPSKLQFEPGQGWSYSNIGMLLAGRIIETVTGENYYDHIQRSVFDRAGMTSASDLVLSEVTPRVATLYDLASFEAKPTFRDASFELPARSAPDGGSVMSARDLLKLASAIRRGKIVQPATFALMATPRNELGAKGRYGFGIMSMEERLGASGRDVVGHGGDVNGGCATFAMVRDASEPYTIVILSNSYMGSCFPVGETALEMIPPVRKAGR